MSNQQGQRGKIFFFGLFAVLALLTFIILRPYVGAIAISLVTVTMLKPLYDWFMRHRWINGRPRLATPVTLITFFLLIIIPVWFVGSYLVESTIEFFDHLESGEAEFTLEGLAASIEDFLHRFPLFEDVEIQVEALADWLVSLGSSILDWLLGSLSGLIGNLAQLIIGGIIFLVVTATLLPALDELGERVRQISPLDVDITQIYLSKSGEMVLSVIKGVFLLVILQGLIMGFFYWLAGIPFTVFWTLLSVAFGVMPVVGISFVVVFIAIIALLNGNTQAALIVLFGFYVVVNPLDLILRPRLVSKEAYLNFTLMLLALFGGLAVGGMLGMIYGPVIMILFVSTIDIYVKYYSDRAAVADGGAQDNAEQDPPRQPIAAGDDEEE